MPRDIPVGNGDVLVAFDKDYQLREFCFPHIGQENHVKNDPFRLGVWVNGAFSWVPQGWTVALDYLDDTLMTRAELTHPRRQIRIISNDIVDFYENTFIRNLTVENLSGEDREIRLFLTHAFHILGNSIGDTAVFRPDVKALLHYKADRYFLINVLANKKPGIDHFATGNRGGEHEGTWRDAEDGILSGNPIAQGSVDSVVAIHLRLKGGEKDSCFYWICAGRDWKEVSELNASVLKKRPEALMKRTADYWRLWADKEELNHDLLPPKLDRLYTRSLLIMRTEIDSCGSIVAATDSDVVRFNRDTYSYMWPRDGALASYALDLAGYPELSQNFFNFCNRIIENDGYFLHKYTPSGMLASSWHPWQKDGRPQLPIQEDETALVIWALWHHYALFRDIEFIRPLYKPLVKSAADFMMSYRDSRTHLPQPSYDLWEERQGVLTFTAAAIYGGLRAAANFTEAFGETALAEEYRQGARELREAMDQYLYLEDEKRFARMVNFSKDGGIEVDKTVDASLFGIFAFGAYDPDDEKVKSTMDQVYERLWCRTPVGGLARYENDAYHRKSDNVPGNPWFLTTLWYAQYLIAAAHTKDELDLALPILEWVCNRALPSAVLAEQVDPYTDEPISVSPLTWSHATYITAIQEYLNKLLELDRCSACNQPNYLKKRRSP